jgi:hypothetical protein
MTKIDELMDRLIKFRDERVALGEYDTNAGAIIEIADMLVQLAKLAKLIDLRIPACPSQNHGSET